MLSTSLVSLGLAVAGSGASSWTLSQCVTVDQVVAASALDQVAAAAAEDDVARR